MSLISLTLACVSCQIQHLQRIRKSMFLTRKVSNRLFFLYFIWISINSSFCRLLLQPQLQLFSCSCSCSWSKKIRIFHEIITLEDHFIVRDSRKQLFNTRKCVKMAKNACFVLQLQLQLQLNSCSCGSSRRRRNELLFKTYPNPEFSGTYSDHPKSGGRAMAPANDQMMPRRIHAQSGPLTLANAGLKT